MPAPRIRRDLRARFPSLAESFARWEAVTDRYDSEQQGRLPLRRLSTGELVLVDAARLTLLSAHSRARALAWGVLAAINAELSSSLFLVARAHLETTGLLAYLLWKCQQFRSGAIPEAVLREQIARLFLGRRTPIGKRPVTDEVKAIQVLNLIDAVDRIFERMDMESVRGGFREGYEWLSEFCHPNSYSRFGEHDWETIEVMVFHRTPRLGEEEISMTLSHLAFSDAVWMLCFKQCTDLLAAWDEELGHGGRP